MHATHDMTHDWDQYNSRIVTDVSERKLQLYIDFLKRVDLLGNVVAYYVYTHELIVVFVVYDIIAPLAEYERRKIAEALEEVSVCYYCYTHLFH
jgi:hypothetical protein